MESKKENIDLPLFDFATTATATNRFSHTSIVGKGGFGSVYKVTISCYTRNRRYIMCSNNRGLSICDITQGSLSTGQEIAVKRLSKNSGQGLEDFKNEVLFNIKILLRFWDAVF